MRPTRHLLPVVALTLLLGACGGGDDNPLGTFKGDPGAAGASGKSTLMNVSVEASGGHCAAGGTRIDAGPDANANGLLDADEVSSTQYVCGGALGVGAASTLVQMLDEPSGPNCVAGGKIINVGLDGNANGVLEAAEISNSGYVCDGSDGANGANGANGSNGANGVGTLISVDREPAGANCAYGGNKITTGADTNANGALDTSEVSTTNYTCNGAPSAELNWIHVTGTSEPAVRNKSYIADNNDAQVVVTLPIGDLLAVGDVVRVNGAGAGGWKIAQNPRQAVNTTNLGGMAGAIWTARATPREWSSVASSGDGRRLVAAVTGGIATPGGTVYTSIDSGATWNANGPVIPDTEWRGVASSADGSTLIAVANGKQIYVSTDFGANWSPSESPQTWSSVASSADGGRLIATVDTDGDGSGGGVGIYISTNRGATWMQSVPQSVAWSSVASSADGSKLVAAAPGGQIHTSGNGGLSWTARETSRQWTSVASSADGRKLIAAAYGGNIHTSGDGGVSWTARESARNWHAVASSADGARLVALEVGGQIYTSSNGGANWTARESSRTWYSVASSADGSKLVAVVVGGQIYTSTATTTLGMGGSISGGASDAIELQYVGNGMFNVSSHEGTLTIE